MSSQMLSYFANPHRFLALSRWLAPALGTIGLALVAYSVWQGLWVAPPERLQGDSARILFVHVPAAWLAMAGYTALAVSSFVWFVWRHELADVAAKSIAPIGAAYTVICLATGSIWGRPTWGTWFEWTDARMVSVLVLLFIYLGYMALRAAMDTRQKAARAGAILAMAGFVNVPLVKFSVDLFASLHQNASVVRAAGPSMSPEYLQPLLLGALGHTLVFAALTLASMRADLFERRAALLRAKALAAA